MSDLQPWWFSPRLEMPAVRQQLRAQVEAQVRRGAIASWSHASSLLEVHDNHRGIPEGMEGCDIDILSDSEPDDSGDEDADADDDEEIDDDADVSASSQDDEGDDADGDSAEDDGGDDADGGDGGDDVEGDPDADDDDADGDPAEDDGGDDADGGDGGDDADDGDGAERHSDAPKDAPEHRVTLKGLPPASEGHDASSRGEGHEACRPRWETPQEQSRRELKAGSAETVVAGLHQNSRALRALGEHKAAQHIDRRARYLLKMSSSATSALRHTLHASMVEMQRTDEADRQRAQAQDREKDMIKLKAKALEAERKAEVARGKRLASQATLEELQDAASRKRACLDS